MDETFTLTLKRPLQLADEPPIIEIRLEEPTTGQIETAMKEAYAISSNIALIAIVAKISPAHVRAMLTTDFNKAVAYLSGFTKEDEAK